MYLQVFIYCSGADIWPTVWPLLDLFTKPYILSPLVAIDLVINVVAALVREEYCVLKTYLRSCGLGQCVQQPLHDDIMPHERQSSMILNSSGDHPPVQSVHKSCSTSATVKQSQPHPATKTESCEHQFIIWCCIMGRGCEKRTSNTTTTHLHEINESSHISLHSTSPFVWG